MEADILSVQYTFLFNSHLKWLPRFLWHSREHTLCHWPWLLVTLWHWMSFAWTLNLSKSVLQTSRCGSENLKQRSGDADFACSECLRHRANWDNRGERGQVSPVTVNSTLCIWYRWKIVSENRWKKTLNHTSLKKPNKISQAGTEDRDSSLFPLQTLESPQTKIKIKKKVAPLETSVGKHLADYIQILNWVVHQKLTSALPHIISAPVCASSLFYESNVKHVKIRMALNAIQGSTGVCKWVCLTFGVA